MTEYIEIDGFKLGLCQKGNLNKKPIIIIGSVSYYEKLFTDDVYKDMHLVFIDHRGFIKPKENNTYDLSTIVEDIEKIRKHLGFDTIYLLGHSGHGFMAMAYAQKYSNYVEGIILSNLAPTNTKERQEQSILYFETYADTKRKEYFLSEISKLESDIKQNPDLRFTSMNIRMQAQSFYNYNYDGAYLWEGVYNNLEALDYLWGNAFATFDTKSFITSFNKPIMLLLSDYDYLVAPTRLWDDLIKDTHILYHKFDKSGHNPMLEEPKLYAKYINEFVSSNKKH